MQNGKLKRTRLVNKRSKRGAKHGPNSEVKLEYGFKSYSKNGFNDVAFDPQRCDFCGAPDKNGTQEELLCCTDCPAKAHPSCMNYSIHLTTRVRLAPWQCDKCKTCTLCGDSGNPEIMLFCDSCDKGYHMTCHTPRIIEQPIGKWACQSCTNELTIGQEAYSPGEATPEVPTEDTDRGQKRKTDDLEHRSQCATPDGFLDNYPDVVPDASAWTVQDVQRFITKIGFPEQATAFKEQEIDGKSLLLMKRSDVLTALSIRLGPALKIYKHIERLQLFLASKLQS